MIEPPEIRYVQCGGRDLAYQVAGSGPAEVVNVLEITVHLDLLWTDPAWAQQFERFGSVWRMAIFQLRGVGLSEPSERRPTAEEQANDILAVMDAAGMRNAIIFASFSTVAGAVVLAASHPERVRALLLLEPLLSGPMAADPDLTGWEPGEARAYASAGLRSPTGGAPGAESMAGIRRSPRRVRVARSDSLSGRARAGRSDAPTWMPR